MFAAKLITQLYIDTHPIIRQDTHKQLQHDNFLLKEFRFVLIDENTPVMTIPLFKNARKDNINERSLILSFKTENGLRAFLEEKYPDKVIHCDCSVFAQLYFAAKYRQNDTAQMIHIGLADIFFNTIDNDSNTLGYITPHDREAQEYICKTNYISKGQFVIKIEDDKYMGLTNEGVVTKSLREYAVALRTNIGIWEKKYKSGKCIAPNFTDTLGSIISCLFAMGRFDKWSYFDGHGINKIIDAI